MVISFIRKQALSLTLLVTALAAAGSMYAVIRVSAERNAAIHRECVAQNQRHTNTIRQLDTSLRALEAHASGARRMALQSSRAFTVLLIDQLAPYRNCQRPLDFSTK